MNLPGKEIPLAFCYIAAYLEKQGLEEVSILDLDFLGGISDHVDREMKRFKPDLVGITSYTANIETAARIAGRVKQLKPDAATVIGGFHASALPQRTLEEFPQFDYLVFGEGEITLYELAVRLKEGKTPEGIPGVAFRKNGKTTLGPVRDFIDPLDSLPVPDRSLVPIKKYIPDPGNYFQLPSSGILYSRGCPFRCTYCSKAVFKNHIRYRSVEGFLDEVGQCSRDFGIYDFRLEDEGPTVNPKKMKELCQGISDRELAITWNCFSRVDTIDREMLGMMKRAGCYHITYGVESAHPETLERIKKKIDLEQASRAILWTKRQGIECKVNFILGFPWESSEDVKTTLRYAMKVSPDLVSFNLFKPLPGSVLFSEMERDGKIKHTCWEDYFVGSEAMPFESITSEKELSGLVRRAFLWFHFRPRYLLQRLVRLLRHPAREISTVLSGLRILYREMLFRKSTSTNTR